MALTKTAFLRGVQCPRMLWLDRHRPEEMVIRAEVQERLDAGKAFGDRAKGMFGPYEEMSCTLPGRELPDKKAMLARTAEHIAAGTPVLCEAAFSYYNNYCAVDILHRTQAGYDICEVKNSPELHEPFLEDVAFQYFIVRRCKIPVDHVYLVLHGSDESNPFLLTDVTSEVRAREGWVNEHLWSLNRLQYREEEVRVDVGPQCEQPYECWYCDYCHRTEA